MFVVQSQDIKKILTDGHYNLQRKKYAYKIKESKCRRNVKVGTVKFCQQKKLKIILLLSSEKSEADVMC